MLGWCVVSWKCSAVIQSQVRMLSNLKGNCKYSHGLVALILCCGRGCWFGCHCWELPSVFCRWYTQPLCTGDRRNQYLEWLISANFGLLHCVFCLVNCWKASRWYSVSSLHLKPWHLDACPVELLVNVDLSRMLIIDNSELVMLLNIIAKWLGSLLLGRFIGWHLCMTLYAMWKQSYLSADCIFHHTFSYPHL